MEAMNENKSVATGAEHIETARTAEQVQTDDDLKNELSFAREANENEHKIGMWAGIKLYPKAMGWSVLLSTALVMEGFDGSLVGGFFAMPAFRYRYGIRLDDGTYQIPAHWQTAISDSSQIGGIIGLYLSGFLVDRMGLRKTYCVALVLITAFIFIEFFSSSLAVLLVGELLVGIPFGMFQTITTVYATEVCPVILRGQLCAYVNLCWVFGQLLSAGVQRAIENRPETDYSGIKLGFAIQFIWPLPLFIGAILAPESPWWLARHGHHEKAIRSLRRLTSRKTNVEFDPEKTVAMMVETDAMEKEMNAGTNYRELFKGTNLRRTEAAACTWVIQILCGTALQGQSTYFYEQAGLDTNFSFDMSIIQYGLGILGTILSWTLLKYVGRRTLYVGGLAILDVILFLVGFLGIPHQSSSISWAIGSMIVVHTFIYDCTVGPVCYVLVPELASARLRQKSTVVARNAYNVVGLVTNSFTPFMLNPSAWNWGPKTGFFWGGITAICLTWAVFRLPETKDRTFPELDVLFEKRVSAWKFKTTKVEVFVESDAVVTTGREEMVF